MKALTIWQPYAGLIAAGIKTIETRGWPAPKNLIGQRVAIHAAKRWDAARVADWDRVTRWLWDRGIYTVEEMKRIIDITGPFACGKVLSIATLAECSLMEVAPNEIEEQFGWFATRRYGWRFEQNQRLQFPPMVAGMQGVWEWVREPREMVCQFCGGKAACYGRYADHDEGHACDECCGHGNEDGWCRLMEATA